MAISKIQCAAAIVIKGRPVKDTALGILGRCVAKEKLTKIQLSDKTSVHCL